MGCHVKSKTRIDCKNIERFLTLYKSSIIRLQYIPIHLKLKFLILKKDLT